MIRAVVLVPIRDNEGRRVAPRLWGELESRLITCAGGFNRVSNIQGAWEHAGRIYRDTCRQYTASLPNWFAMPAWLEVIRWACDAFRQEAIYFEVAGIPEVYLPQSHGPNRTEV